ncbi:MAG: hypothetical protein KGS72_26345 [Cyanobacteria bacterium REEB67]|nr:hypothetical protein [Cyanobacteria bacterium REEB67]
MSANILANRINNIKQRTNSDIGRAEALIAEARKSIATARFPECKTRGLFVSHLIEEAKQKLVEIRILTSDFNPDAEIAIDCIAICEAWSKSACDLLNRAGRVLDDVEDIWGTRRPTGGLHDK